MAENIRFYIHETARPTHKRRAMELSDVFSKRRDTTSTWQWLRYPLDPIPDEVGTAVVVGGDGSLRSVAERMHDRQNPGVVLAAGGGSQNGFRGSLIHAEGIISPGEVTADPEQMDIKYLKPARANEHMFLYIAEYGRAAEPFSKRNEGYRYSPIPRSARMFVAAVKTGLDEAGRETNEPILHGFFTTPDFKSQILFPEQDLYSDEITMITIPPMNKKEMIIFSSDLLTGLRKNKQFPADLLHVRRAPEVYVPASDTHQQTISFGGDVFKLDEHKGLTVSRKDTKPLRVAALYQPLKRGGRKS